MHRVRRMLLRRLIAPLTRGQHAPEYTARGTAVGLAVAFTPTVGVQMPAVFLLWVLIRYLRPSWEFNLVVAVAWTWLTNVFTLAPVYYIFLLTGRILMGRWNSLQGFDVFQERLNTSLAVDAGPLESLWAGMINLLQEFGLPMAVGSIPWALLLAWFGYRWSLRLVIRIRARRELRLSVKIKPSSET